MTKKHSIGFVIHVCCVCTFRRTPGKISHCVRDDGSHRQRKQRQRKYLSVFYLDFQSLTVAGTEQTFRIKTIKLPY